LPKERWGSSASSVKERGGKFLPSEMNRGKTTWADGGKEKIKGLRRKTPKQNSSDLSKKSSLVMAEAGGKDSKRRKCTNELAE